MIGATVVVDSGSRRRQYLVFAYRVTLRWWQRFESTTSAPLVLVHQFIYLLEGVTEWEVIALYKADGDGGRDGSNAVDDRSSILETQVKTTELITPDSIDQVLLLQSSAEDISKGEERVVSLGMSVRVVDLFKVVKIPQREKHRHTALRGGDLEGEVSLFHRPSVSKSSERIGEGMAAPLVM